MKQTEPYGYPAYTRVLFGCGSQADALKQRTTRDNSGMPTRMIKLRPTPKMYEHYNLSNKLDNDGTITMNYPEDLIRTLNHDESMRTILILCSFDHQRTTLMDEESLIEKIRDLRSSKMDLLRQNGHLREENRRLRQQNEEFLMDQFRLISRIQKSGNPVIYPGKEEEQPFGMMGQAAIPMATRDET